MEEEIVLSVMETYEVENQELSTLIAVFAISGQSKIRSEEQNQ